jgi:iron complex outermembrane receptor protein
LIGDASQTHFDDGGFSFLQNSTNLDFSKSFKTVAEGLNLGLGTEFRYEKYKIFQGEEKSYKGYHPDPILYSNLIDGGSDTADCYQNSSIRFTRISWI